MRCRVLPRVPGSSNLLERRRRLAVDKKNETVERKSLQELTCNFDRITMMTDFQKQILSFTAYDVYLA